MIMFINFVFVALCNLEDIENVKDKLILVIIIYKLWAVHDRGFYIVYKKFRATESSTFFCFTRRRIPLPVRTNIYIEPYFYLICTRVLYISIVQHS